jgi:hypothetical protein
LTRQGSRIRLYRPWGRGWPRSGRIRAGRA